MEVFAWTCFYLVHRFMTRFKLSVHAFELHDVEESNLFVFFVIGDYSKANIVCLQGRGRVMDLLFSDLVWQRSSLDYTGKLAGLMRIVLHQGHCGDHHSCGRCNTNLMRFLPKTRKITLRGGCHFSLLSCIGIWTSSYVLRNRYAPCISRTSWGDTHQGRMGCRLLQGVVLLATHVEPLI